LNTNSVGANRTLPAYRIATKRIEIDTINDFSPSTFRF